jgi:hypothetical protein
VGPPIVDPGLVGPGLVDPGLVDPGLVDPGLVDPGLVDTAVRAWEPLVSGGRCAWLSTIPVLEATARTATETTAVRYR